MPGWELHQPSLLPQCHHTDKLFAVKAMTVVESYCTFFQFDCCGGKTYSDYAGSKFQNDTKAEGLQVSTAKALCQVGVARKGDSWAKYSIVPEEPKLLKIFMLSLK